MNHQRIPTTVPPPAPDVLQSARTTAPASHALEVLAAVAAPRNSALPLPRLLIVFAHPDDEVIALGARLERLAASRLVTVTDGAPEDGADARDHGFATLEQYRLARQQELAAALQHAGIDPQIAGSLPGCGPIPVPDQTAALHLAPLSVALAHVAQQFAPQAILTHPYEGGHPDHDACAFAVHAAVRLLAASGPQSRPLPVIIEAPSYHAAPDGSMQTGTFLPCSPEVPTTTQTLSEEEQANKQARFACFASQAAVLSQFGTEQESFRLAPAYDFTRPPHPGTLFYDQFPWGMTGERFRTLSTAAWTELFAEPTGCRPQRNVSPTATPHASAA